MAEIPSNTASRRDGDELSAGDGTTMKSGRTYGRCARYTVCMTLGNERLLL